MVAQERAAEDMFESNFLMDRVYVFSSDQVTISKSHALLMFLRFNLIKFVHMFLASDPSLWACCGRNSIQTNR